LVKLVANFGCVFSLFFTAKIGARRVEIGARFCQQKIKQNRIFGLRFVPVFFRDTFIINIDSVSE